MKTATFLFFIAFVLTIIKLYIDSQKVDKSSNRKQMVHNLFVLASCEVIASILLGIGTEKLLSQLNIEESSNEIIENSSVEPSTISNEDYFFQSDDSQEDYTDNTESVNDNNVFWEEDANSLIVDIRNDKYGYIDQNGNVIIDYQYDFAHPFSEGLAAVRKGFHWGFIDKEGIVIIPFSYDGAWNFINGLAPVFQDGLYGFIDKEENLVIPYQYTNISLYNHQYYDSEDNLIVY